MKTKEELDAIKEEVEAVNEKLAELTEEEIAQVNGGVVPQHGAIRQAFKHDIRGVVVDGN